MSEENQMSSGQPVDQAGGDSGDTQQSTSGADKVAYDTYKKLLGEKKAADSRLKELEMKFNAMENEKLEKNGQSNELVQKLQTQVSDLSNRLEQKDKAYAFATLSSQVKTTAAQMGCQSPDDLVKLMDISTLPVDPETFRANDDAIKMLVEDGRKSRPFLFVKTAPNVQDVSQNNTVLNKPAVDFSKMTRDELAEYAKDHGNKLD